MPRKRIVALLLCFAITASMVGCAENTQSAESDTTQNNQQAEEKKFETNVVDVANMFSSRDKEIGYDEENSIAITLDSSTIQASSNQVVINGTTATISEEGTYIVSGTLNDGQIIVDADKTAKIQIVLRDAHITSASSAPIYIKQADKVFITLAESTSNSLATSGEYSAIDENNIDAVLFSKEDLTLNGLGSLEIQSDYGHGVVSKDDLVVTSGTYNITCTGHGLAGKDSVRIADGILNITSGKDSIHSENTEDAQKGFIYIASGEFDLTAQTDAIDAEFAVQIDGGKFHLLTGGGSANASTTAEGMHRPEWGNWEQKTQTQAEDTPSAKGVKANGDIVINAGTLTIDSSDDSIHSNANVTICGGNIDISSGDDGIHADAKTIINDGKINIAKSYEGIEGQSIDVFGGEISIIATDDGMNSAGGNDSSALGNRPGKGSFAVQEDCYINISGGKTTVNAKGDGIDSNGVITVSGGETYVSGAENSGNAPLDCNGSAVITGGTFVGTGMSGMAQNFTEGSTQGTMLVNVDTTQSSALVLIDSNGNELVSYSPPKQYNSILISTPQIAQEQTYTLNAGTASKTVEMTELIYGEAGGMGGFPHGGKGERPEMGNRPTPPSLEGGNPPEMPPANMGGMAPQQSAQQPTQ